MKVVLHRRNDTSFPHKPSQLPGFYIWPEFLALVLYFLGIQKKYHKTITTFQLNKKHHQYHYPKSDKECIWTSNLIKRLSISTYIQAASTTKEETVVVNIHKHKPKTSYENELSRRTYETEQITDYTLKFTVKSFLARINSLTIKFSPCIN